MYTHPVRFRKSLQRQSMQWTLTGILLALFSFSADSAWGNGGGLERRASSPGAVVYIISPASGETVSSPVLVQFGLRGMGIAPAGVEKVGTGHHHLLIDTDLPSDMSLPIAADDQHRHYGGGQTETVLELAPGPHTLQLLLGDERHVPLDPPVVSEKIEIEVQ